MPVNKISHTFFLNLILFTVTGRFLLSLLILEREISFHRTESSTTDKSTDSLSDLRYINGRLIPEQPMFLAIVRKIYLSADDSLILMSRFNNYLSLGF